MKTYGRALGILCFGLALALPGSVQCVKMKLPQPAKANAETEGEGESGEETDARATGTGVSAGVSDDIDHDRKRVQDFRKHSHRVLRLRAQAQGRQVHVQRSNAQGCVVPKTKLTLKELGGVYPVEEFQGMLDSRLVSRFWSRTENRARLDLTKTFNLSWCPAPRTVPEHDDLDVIHAYLEKALSGTDTSQPLIVASAEIKTETSVSAITSANFFCGLERLGLSNRSAVLALTEQSEKILRKWNPSLRVLSHPKIREATKKAADRSNIPPNRMAKLVLADILLGMGREVLLTDLDTHWFQDPSEHLQKLAKDEGVEFAAMNDYCWLELNSGFLYYRPTNQTRLLVRAALGMSKPVLTDPSQTGVFEIYADNDQYLLNCAFAHSAVRGLKYRILPPQRFDFIDSGGMVNLNCRPKSVVDQYAQVGLSRPWLLGYSTSNETRYAHVGLSQQQALARFPFVWHMGGVDTKETLDMIAALGIMDVKTDQGQLQCVGGPRGMMDDVALSLEKLRRSCVEDPDPGAGILHYKCNGSCKPGRPEYATKIQEDISLASRSPASNSLTDR